MERLPRSLKVQWLVICRVSATRRILATLRTVVIKAAVPSGTLGIGDGDR